MAPACPLCQAAQAASQLAGSHQGLGVLPDCVAGAAASIYGRARAFTPLLSAPLEGPVYLHSSSHKPPDLAGALNGQIQIALDGRIDSVKGGIRTSFEAVPDAPVTKFILEMQGGNKGLLVNSTNLCASTNRATAKFDAQNGKASDFNPVLTNSCGAKGKQKRGNR